MPLFEVVLHYEGESTYFVEAADDDAAMQAAKGRYSNGENSDHAGDSERLIEARCTVSAVESD